MGFKPTTENASAVYSFILEPYFDFEDHRYLYFTGFLFLFILLLLANIILVVVVYIERGLHEPMYFFMCNLSINGIYGSLSLFPALLTNLMSHTYEISLAACLVQIFCIHTYAAIEFFTLAVMSYDRYVAICHPLHYHRFMSDIKVCIYIALCWIYPCVLFGIDFLFTVQHSFCDSIIDKLYCVNFELVKLSCVENSFQGNVGLVVTILIIVPQLLMILFSYAQILRICLFVSKESQAKAIQTCTPHLLAVINNAVCMLFEIMQTSFNNHVPHKACVFMSLYVLIFPPLSNPLIYGISIKSIRVRIVQMFSAKKNKLTPQQMLTRK